MCLLLAVLLDRKASSARLKIQADPNVRTIGMIVSLSNFHIYSSVD